MEEDVKNIRIEDYSYELSDDRIAKYPVEPRDSSRLLVFEENEIRDKVYRQLGEQLPPNSLLLFNQTKVIQARLIFQKNEQTSIEIFCLEPASGQDIQQAMQSGSPIDYKCLVGGARKWKHGLLEIKTKGGETLSAEKLGRDQDSFIIRFRWTGGQHFASILEEVGNTPLPPYLGRAAEEGDKERYQTLFAKTEGSVAAPTAGLHFTEPLMEDLARRNVQMEFVTLHVGAGTFKPVSSDRMSDHDMHGEEFFIRRSLVDSLLANLDKTVIPVGTTSLRALESIYWLGVKIIEKRIENDTYEIDQWEPYKSRKPHGVKAALQAVALVMSENQLDILTAQTRLIIAPGYKHRICSGLLTNFHQPRSTLLLLVASFVGEDWKEIYKHALAENYRFLSYGDGCLILDKRNKIST